MNLVILIPALNEADSIAQVVEAMPSSIDRVSKIDVLVIDDGSRDATADLARAAGATVISHPFNPVSYTHLTLPTNREV